MPFPNCPLEIFRCFFLCPVQFKNNPKYRIYKIFQHSKEKSGSARLHVNRTCNSLIPNYVISFKPFRLTGGTENIASTKMKKQLGVSGDAEPETWEGSQSGVPSPSTDQTSEGRKKAMESMFDNMALLGSKSSSKSKKKKRGDDDSSDDDKPPKRRREEQDPKLSPEAGFTWFCLLHASSTHFSSFSSRSLQKEKQSRIVTKQFEGWCLISGS